MQALDFIYCHNWSLDVTNQEISAAFPFESKYTEVPGPKIYDIDEGWRLWVRSRPLLAPIFWSHTGH